MQHGQKLIKTLETSLLNTMKDKTRHERCENFILIKCKNRKICQFKSLLKSKNKMVMQTFHVYLIPFGIRGVQEHYYGGEGGLSLIHI